jgi:magnesium-transporting ATPase (P-type)
LKVLIVAAIVSLILGIATEGWDDGWYEGVAILVAVAIIVNVTATNNWLKERQFQKLNARKNEKMMDVVRGGRIEHVNTQELLVGDILKFIYGDLMPVDGILLRGEGSPFFCKP